MNYRHSYHAGNFADIFRHATLAFVLSYLKQKPKPFFVLDTHAGTGLYNLDSQEAQKTLEYKDGIERILKTKESLSTLAPYLEVVRSLNPSILHKYPGSPLITKMLLRKEDRLLISELHPEDYLTLKNLFQNDPQVTPLNQDGYTLLKSSLPPFEKRGLILIDPPFEKRDEFEMILKGLEEGYKRFQTGIFMVWFPIKSRNDIEEFYEKVRQKDFKKVLKAELFVKPLKNPIGLSGCGLLIINTPWLIPEFLEKTLPFLVQKLALEGNGSFNWKWLKEE